MRISRQLLATLSLVIGLNFMVVPYEAHAAILGSVPEGGQLTINGFRITNPNAFPVTLTDVSVSVTNFNFAGDPTDYVQSAFFSGGLFAPGSCFPLLNVFQGFLSGATCLVNVTFSATPSDDFSSEPVDFGVSQITLSATTHPGGTGSLLFEIKVTDTPEPGSVALLSSGVASLLCCRRISKSREGRVP